MKLGALIATIFLALVALARLFRVALQVEVTAGGMVVPMRASALACVATGGLAVLLWRESRQ